MRTIQSIRTLRNSRNIITYVNFENNYFGTITKNRETGERTTFRLTDEEVAEAKRLAYRDGKWTDYRRPTQPKPVVGNSKRIADVEGPDDGSMTAEEESATYYREPNPNEIYG
jgi:hypothetical protein